MNTYICKCGKTFKKSTKAASTGYVLEGYTKGHECFGCPYIIEHEDWNTRKTIKWECRATPKIKYQTYGRIGTRDKDFSVCYFYTLDLDFAKSVYVFCKTVEGYTGGAYSDKWRAADFADDKGMLRFVLNFAMNKKGTEARRIINDKFFEGIDYGDERDKIINNIQLAISKANGGDKMPTGNKSKPKRQLDANIASSIKSAVSDSFSDNINMIDVDKLFPHEDNFYSMSEIEILAEDIERQGLKSNLVVRKNNPNSYTVISGHRRLEAIKLLIKQGRRTSRFVPCYINPKKSDDEELHDLIMLNATTRVLNDNELIEQYERLKVIFEGKKAAGENIRMRERIAEVLNVSNGQVAKAENVAKNAATEVKAAVKDGKMSLSTANEVAKLGKDEQRELLENKGASSVSHKDAKAAVEKNKPKSGSVVTCDNEPKDGSKAKATPAVNNTRFNATSTNPEEDEDDFDNDDTDTDDEQDKKYSDLQKTCMGYAVEVCREMGFDKEGINNFISIMSDKFIEHSVTMAALIYSNRFK